MSKFRLYIEEVVVSGKPQFRYHTKYPNGNLSSRSIFSSKSDMLANCVEDFGTGLIDASTLEIISSKKLLADLHAEYKKKYPTPAEIHIGSVTLGNTTAYAWVLEPQPKGRTVFSEMFDRTHAAVANCVHVFGYDLFDTGLYSIKADLDMITNLRHEWGYEFPEGFEYDGKD